METIKLTKRNARKVAESINGALCSGAGNGEGQNVCIMQAIARALDLPTSDDHVEECVGTAVSAFSRGLNDCSWSSPQNRAEGMKRLGVASLGSNTLDQMAFGKLMFLRGTQKLLPFVFRKIAESKAGDHQAELRKHADLCEKAATFDEAKKTCKGAYASAYASASASAYAYASASAYASTSTYAYASASASTYAYASASAYADFKPLREKDALLRLTADIGLQCLTEMKSPGVKWLDVVDAAESR